MAQVLLALEPALAKQVAQILGREFAPQRFDSPPNWKTVTHFAGVYPADLLVICPQTVGESEGTIRLDWEASGQPGDLLVVTHDDEPGAIANVVRGFFPELQRVRV